MAGKILIVDDMEINRDFLQEIMCTEYETLMAEDGVQAMEHLNKQHEDIKVVLLDLHMPNMDGFEVMTEMQENGMMSHIPVLVITGEYSVEVENRCFKYGISDFIRKPFEPSIIKKRVKNIVELFDYKKSLEEKVEKQTEALRQQYQLLQKQALQLKESNIRIIDILGMVVEFRNLESGEHIKRVKGYTEILAKQLMKDYPEYGLTEGVIEMIVAASSLHDIGKITTPDHILLKPGKLTDEEFDIMKTHTTKGCEILDNIEGIWDDEYSRYAYNICRYHHERYDGRGYPDGLKGDEIPIPAQIVSVADVYDALVNDRVYKKAFPKDVAYGMIRGGQCGQFSPKLMDCFEKVKEQFEELTENGNHAEDVE